MSSPDPLFDRDLARVRHAAVTVGMVGLIVQGAGWSFGWTVAVVAGMALVMLGIGVLAGLALTGGVYSRALARARVDLVIVRDEVGEIQEQIRRIIAARARSQS